MASGSEQEAEYLFNVVDCTFVQRVRGTVTYIVKSADLSIQDASSIQEKIDFKMNVPCSSFLVESSCDSDDLAKWLTSGQLTAKHSLKCETQGSGNDIQQAVERLTSTLTKLNGKYTQRDSIKPVLLCNI